MVAGLGQVGVWHQPVPPGRLGDERLGAVVDPRQPQLGLRLMEQHAAAAHPEQIYLGHGPLEHLGDEAPSVDRQLVAADGVAVGVSDLTAVTDGEADRVGLVARPDCVSEVVLVQGAVLEEGNITAPVHNYSHIV